MEQRSLRDHMLSLALSGDDTAAKCLEAALPHPLPAHAAIRFRNAQLVEIATWLARVVVAPTDHKLAVILAAAGSALESRRTLGLIPETAELTMTELVALADRIRPLIDAERPWPGERMIRNVILGCWK